MKKNVIYSLTFIFLLFSFVNSVFSQDFSSIFNSNLSNDELYKIKSGEVLIRNTKTLSNICLNSCNSNTGTLLTRIKNTKPAYLAEIIQVIPENQNSDTINQLYKILMDIPSYKGIPYYSEHNDIWVDLYSQADIINSKSSGTSASSTDEINAYFFMIPFNDIYSNITIKKSKNDLYYENVNTNQIKYKGIVCVNKGNMVSLISVFKHDKYFVLYGIGGVNAPRLPGLNSRIELSFMNRIKTFCNFVFSKLK